MQDKDIGSIFYGLRKINYVTNLTKYVYLKTKCDLTNIQAKLVNQFLKKLGSDYD